jgi:hypothetical protein
MPEIYSDSDTFTDSGHIYYINQDLTSQIIKQTTYSLKNFYNFKQIIVKSTLPTRSYKIYEDQSDIVIDSQILIDISLNSENYNPSMNTLSLIPNSFRNFELVSPVGISNFVVWFEVKYSNNKSFQLKMSPKQFASITLCFQRNLTDNGSQLV